MHQNRSQGGETSNQFRNVAHIFEKQVKGGPLTTFKSHTFLSSTQKLVVLLYEQYDKVVLYQLYSQLALQLWNKSAIRDQVKSSMSLKKGNYCQRGRGVGGHVILFDKSQRRWKDLIRKPVSLYDLNMNLSFWYKIMSCLLNDTVRFIPVYYFKDQTIFRTVIFNWMVSFLLEGEGRVGR